MVGVITYSKGDANGGPGSFAHAGGGLVAVIAHSIVLFLFASEGLEHLLASAGLPTIPLVPVSSSQAIVGAVIGIGLLKGAHTVRWRVVGNIGLAWAATPLISALICLMSLYILQNVFNQEVYRPVTYSLSTEAMEKLGKKGIPAAQLAELEGETFKSGTRFLRAVNKRVELDQKQERQVLWYAEIGRYKMDSSKIGKFSDGWLTSGQIEALRQLSGMEFTQKWRIAEALAARNDEWKLLPETKVNKLHNKDIRERLDVIFRTFSEE